MSKKQGNKTIDKALAGLWAPLGGIKPEDRKRIERIKAEFEKNKKGGKK